MYQHNYLRSIFLFLTAFLLLSACGDSEHQDAEQILAGEESKTWRIDQETTATGDQRALTQSEDTQRVTFSADGTFQVRDATEVRTGTWTYRPTERMLELEFDDQPGIAETYYVSRLEEDALDVRAPDGATMQYTAE
jgi:outer membrane biogenesis lipoprotein LolB